MRGGVQGGFVGLNNLDGDVAYMDVVLQQWFMSPPFRELVLSIALPSQPPSMQDEIKSLRLLQELKNIFVYLEKASNSNVGAAVSANGNGAKHKKKKPDPYDLTPFVQAVEDCFSLRKDFRDPSNDPSEFAAKLLAKLSSSLGMFSHRDQAVSLAHEDSSQSLDETTGLSLVRQKICIACHTLTNQSGKCWAVGCRIKDVSTLKDSLAIMTADQLVEVAEGGLTMRCDNCGSDTDHALRTRLANLPSLLMFDVKRLSTDFKTHNTTKINSRFEFDEMLDMRPYTMERERAERAQLPDSLARQFCKTLLSFWGPPPEDEDAAAAREDERIIASESFQYQLVGAIVHNGSASGGDLCSLVKERLDPDLDADDYGAGDRWFRFSGDRVTPFDPTNLLAAECFGGQEDDTTGHRQSSNALMLFYEKVKR